MSLKTLSEWMLLLSGSEGRQEMDDLSADAFGAGDAAYLVLEKRISTSPNVSDQYVLHPLPGGNPLFQQLRFLADCDFDLRSVMDRLSGADYLADELNEVARFASVEVARYRIREN